MSAQHRTQLVNDITVNTETKGKEQALVDRRERTARKELWNALMKFG